MKYLYLTIVFLSLFLSPEILVAQETKSTLKILVVAYNPEKEYSGYMYGSRFTSRMLELNKTRGEEWKMLLSPYFKTVDLVYDTDYNYQLSYDYDVTIMDALPEPVDKVDYGKTRYGKSIMRGDSPFMVKRYVPENFDRAVISIGILTDDLVAGLVSAFQPQCHCIQKGYAVNPDTGHTIFNSPLKVDPTFKNELTPKNYKKYYSGVNLANEIETWPVQTESVKSGKGYITGLILNGMGFGDSPDSEFISGSHSLKDITGMALGRNANFFHWGFSGSPNFMTEEAKNVFINTVFYMAQFNGKTPIMTDLGASRKWARELCYRKTGKLLTLDIDDVETTGSKDKDSIYNFYKENYTYFRFLQPKRTTPIVDEEAKSLGIANNSIQLLEKCIELLNANEKTELALTLLYRYTNFKYDSPEEWTQWYNTYKNYLFFTELGGYKFYIDTWNHPHLKSTLNQS